MRTDLVGLIGAASPITLGALLLLLVFSIFSWAVILFKWRFFRRVSRQDRRFLRLYEALEDPKEVRRRAATIVRSPLATLFAEAYRRALHDDEPLHGEHVRRLERGLIQIADRHLMEAEEYLGSLATVGNVSPFIGLFGTVLGIIQAFQEIARQGTASIAAVAPGVAEALVATAAGLFTAIPAGIAYNHFVNKPRRYATQLDVFRNDLIAQAEGRQETEATVLKS